MADILEGVSNHVSHAPLSHAQTLAVCKHLMNEIQALKQKHEDLEKDFHNADNGQTGLRELLDGTNTHLLHLQEGLDGANAAVDALRKDGGRYTNDISKLMNAHEQTTECLAMYREGQKVNDTKVRNIEQDLALTTRLATDLRDKLEKRVFADIVSLQDDLSKTNHDLKGLAGEEQTTRENLLEERKNLRTTNGNVQALRDDLTKTNTVVRLVETRLADNTSGLKMARDSMEALNETVQRIYEDLERTKKEASDAQGGVKTNASTIKKNGDVLDRALSGLHATQARMDEAGGGLDAIRRLLEATQGKVQSLMEGQDMAQRALRNVKAELLDVSATANQVKNGLKETNSLVLPNLHMDISLPTVSTPPARAERDRHIKKVSKGGAGNRMAWI